MWRRRLLAAAPWVLVVAGLIAAGFSTWQWQQLESRAQERDRVRLATSEFMTTLTNWDSDEGLDATRRALQEAGTGDFLQQLEQFFQPMTGDLPADVSSSGRVEHAYVQSVGDGRAESFAVVVQTVDRGQQSSTTVRYAVLTLRQVDGEWLVADLRLLADDARPQPGPRAPTPAPTATPTAPPPTPGPAAPTPTVTGQDQPAGPTPEETP